MNVADLPGVEAIRPPDVQQYLIHNGWRRLGEPKNDVARFERETDRGPLQAEVLLDPSFADYVRRTGELIESLSRLEDRPVLAVLEDLLTPPADVVHLRVASDGVKSGWIPLDDAIRLREAQKQLLLSIAHSVLEPRAHFARLSQSQAVALLAECREGPTTRASYATSILVPVSPAVGQVPLLDDPYPRRVTRLLMSALVETSRIVDAADPEALLGGAAGGLSANFLAALAALRPSGERSFVEIGVRWSRARAAPPLPRSKVRLGEGVFLMIEEASRTLRERTPTPGMELEGFVVALVRETNDPGRGGTVTIATQIEGRPGTSKVRMELAAEGYRKATEAHQQGGRVKVLGTLVKEGRGWLLREPSGFDVLPSDVE